jgi:hypothetical protein
VNFRTLLVSLLVFFLAFSPAHAAHLLKIGQIVPLAKTRTESFPTNFSDPSGLAPVQFPVAKHRVTSTDCGAPYFEVDIGGSYDPETGQLLVTVTTSSLTNIPVNIHVDTDIQVRRANGNSNFTVDPAKFQGATQPYAPTVKNIVTNQLVGPRSSTTAAYTGSLAQVSNGSISVLVHIAADPINAPGPGPKWTPYGGIIYEVAGFSNSGRTGPTSTFLDSLRQK